MIVAGERRGGGSGVRVGSWVGQGGSGEASCSMGRVGASLVMCPLERWRCWGEEWWRVGCSEDGLVS